MSKSKNLETIAIHAGNEVDAATGAVSQPIHLTTTFEREPDGSFPHGFVYARADNPTRKNYEHLLASLEGGAAALAFASGSAAAGTIFRSISPNAHVMCLMTCTTGFVNCCSRCLCQRVCRCHLWI